MARMKVETAKAACIAPYCLLRGVTIYTEQPTKGEFQHQFKK